MNSPSPTNVGSSFPSESAPRSGAPLSPSLAIILPQIASPQDQRKAILRHVRSIFDKGGICRFLSSTLMYQKPSLIHVFSTSDLGFLVEHRAIWIAAFQNKKNSSLHCDYSALSVILWNVLQGADRDLRETLTLLSSIAPSSPVPIPLPPTASSSSVSSPPLLSSSWFARHPDKWDTPEKREKLNDCLRRTTYASTLLAALLSPVTRMDVRASLRVSGDDVRRVSHLVQHVISLYVDLACWVEGGVHFSSGLCLPSTPVVEGDSSSGAAGTSATSSSSSPPPPSLAPRSRDQLPLPLPATTSAREAMDSHTLSSAQQGGPGFASLPHQPPPCAYDPLTHHLFLAVEECYVQLQILLVTFPRCTLSQVGEAELELVMRLMYHPKVFEASGLSLRSTEAYLAAVKELLLGMAASPQRKAVLGWQENITTLLMDRVFQRPAYRHHPFRLSFLRETADHQVRQEETEGKATQKGIAKPATAVAEAGAPPLLLQNPTTSTPDSHPSRNIFSMAEEGERVSPLLYPGGRCGGVLEPSFGILRLFWSVKEGVESILCPTSTTPVLALIPLTSASQPDSLHASPTLPSPSFSSLLSSGEGVEEEGIVQRVVRMLLLDSEKKALREVFQLTHSAFERSVQQCQEMGKRMSFYQLLGYGLFFGMPEVDLRPAAPFMERAWSTHLLAPSSFPPLPYEGFPSCFSPSTQRKREENKVKAEEKKETEWERVGRMWASDPSMQQYYGPVLRLLFATCFTVRTDGGDVNKIKKDILHTIRSGAAVNDRDHHGGSGGSAQDQDEDEAGKWELHVPLLSDSILPLWDSICHCLFQEGVLKQLHVPATPSPPPLPPLHMSPCNNNGRGEKEEEEERGGCRIISTSSPTSSSLTVNRHHHHHSPTTTTLKNSYSPSDACCRVYSPFTVHDVPFVLDLCRLILLHPFLKSIPRHAAASTHHYRHYQPSPPSNNNSSNHHHRESGGRENHPKQQPQQQQRDAATFSSSSSSSSIGSSLPNQEGKLREQRKEKTSPPLAGRASIEFTSPKYIEEENVRKAWSIVETMQTQLSIIVGAWYRVCENIQERLFVDMPSILSSSFSTRSPSLSPSSSSSGKKMTMPEPAAGTRTEMPSSPPFSSALSPTSPSQTTTEGSVPPSPEVKEGDGDNGATPPLSPPSPSLSSSSAIQRRDAIAGIMKDIRFRIPGVALRRFSDWIEMFVLVGSWIIGTGAVEKCVFPPVLIPPLLDTLTRLYAIYTVYIEKGGATPGVTIATGPRGGSSGKNRRIGGRREASYLAAPSTTMVTASTAIGIQRQVGTLVLLLKHIPATLAPFAVDELLVGQLAPLAKQLALDREWYGRKEDERNDPSSSSQQQQKRRTPALSPSSPPPPPRSALFYARVEGYFHALGTPVAAYVVGDVPFLLYWVDVAITGVQAKTTPSVPSVMCLLSLWKAALNFFHVAFFSKRPLCPLLLPSLVHLMIPSLSHASSSSSESPPPPLSLLREFASRLFLVCQCVVECDGEALSQMLEDESSPPQHIARSVLQHSRQKDEGAEWLLEGGGHSWISPLFFFTSSEENTTHPSLCTTTTTGGSNSSTSSSGNGWMASGTPGDDGLDGKKRMMASTSLPLFSSSSLIAPTQKKPAAKTPEVTGAAAGSPASPGTTTSTTATTSPSIVTPGTLQEALKKITPCSAVLLVVSSLFDHLCVVAKELVSSFSSPSLSSSPKTLLKGREFSLYFSALCNLLRNTHVEVLPRVCASVEALLTEHLTSRMSVVVQLLQIIEPAVAQTTGPLKAPLAEWYLHLVNKIGVTKNRSKL